MEKIHIINREFCHTRIDRWIKNNICKVPQGLIEKNLRIGKIKLNKKKIKSSTKLASNDIINVLFSSYITIIILP